MALKKILRPVYYRSRNFLMFPVDFFNYFKSQQISAVQKDFAKELSAFKPDEKGKSNGILLIQYLQDYEYTIKFAVAAKTYAEQNNLNVSFYNVSWTRWIGWGNKFEPLFNRYFKSANDIIHESFGGKIIFKNEEKFSDQNLIAKQLQKILGELSKPEEVLKIKFENVLVGDLIYDTYLRYFNEPTIETINANLIKVIEIALNIYYNFKRFIEKNNIKALFNSYNAYIEHGISARICLEKGIKVFTFGSYSYLIQEATLEYPYHSINHSLFSPEKKISPENLELAKEIFTSRFKGVIDEATRYMRVSAFAEKPISEELTSLFKNSKRNVVIYTHDFYDSPHVNRCLQFPDLYQFIKQTLNAIKGTTDTTFYIKTHPNSYGDCKERTIELVKSFGVSHFHVLDDSVSNLHVVSLKPDLIVTGRGAVGPEMSHFKIPAVALYDNIYINFNFVHSCRDIESFFQIIKGEKQPTIDFEQKNIYSFYYQAYMEKVLPGKDNVVLRLVAKDGGSFSDVYLSNLLNSGFSEWKMELFGHFKNAINQLSK